MKKLHIILLVLISIILIAAAAGGYLFWKVRGLDGVVMRSQEVTVIIQTSGAKVGQPFDINVSISSRWDRDDMEAIIGLPTSAVYLDGDWMYRGPVKAKEEKKLKMKAAFLEEGKWLIAAGAQVNLGGKSGSVKGPVPSGSAFVGFEVTSTSVKRLESTSTTARFRPQSKVTTSTREGEPPALGISFEGPRNDAELLNRSDQQLFLVINDRAGIEELRRKGLTPEHIWGAWGPFAPFTGSSALYTDFNGYFLIGIYDKQRPSTGYRAYIEEMVVHPTSLDVYVRFASPPEALPVAQKPTSPYELVTVRKELMFEADKPIEVRFIADGKVINSQSVVLRKAWQGKLQWAFPVEQLKTIAIQKVSEKTKIPVEQLKFREVQQLTTGELGILPSRYYFLDNLNLKQYSIELDPYGREVDSMAIGHACSRARYARYNGGIEKKLSDLLDNMKDDDAVPAEIWWIANSPGASYREVNQPMVDSLKSLGVDSHLDNNLPFGKATILKKKIPEVLALEKVVFVGIQEVK